MAYTVDAAFGTFYDQINLSGDHRATANARKDAIVSLLKNDFDIQEAFSSGSIPKFTALKDRADLDVIVALHYGKHIKDKTPIQVLESIRKPLSQYRTNVRKNGQAVTLHYQTWPSVDIVPVSRVIDDNGNLSYYNVPNANTGQWIPSRPKTLADEINAKASECGANFRRIIKMVKHWNHVHSEYLSSYHIEVLALNVFSGNLDDTTWHILQFFKEARNLLNGRIWYGVGHVDDYLSPTDRLEVQRRFDTAIEKSREAWCCTYNNPNGHEDAIRLWRQVFGDKFPTYG